MAIKSQKKGVPHEEFSHHPASSLEADHTTVLPTQDSPTLGRTYQKSILSEQEQITNWLQQFGFLYNPFEFKDSERDYNLKGHFVETIDFERIIDQSHWFLFAGAGKGKTALRQHTQALCRDSLAYDRLFAFSYLIPQAIADRPPDTLTEHLPHLLTAAVRHAFILFALSGSALPELSNPSIAQQFSPFFDQFYGLTTWRDDLQIALEERSLQHVLNNLTPTYDDLDAPNSVGSVNVVWLEKWLQLLQPNQGELAGVAPTYPDCDNPVNMWTRFCDLLTEVGLDTILILVDGVDTKPTATKSAIGSTNGLSGQNGANPNGTERMVKIMRALLDAAEQSWLGDKTYLKFFLSQELFLPLTNRLRAEQNVDILYWTYEQMQQMLTLRLSAASNGAITSLAQLTEADVSEKLEVFLIALADFSPRVLIHSVNRIFGEHIKLTPTHQVPGKLSRLSLSQIHYLRHNPP